jgi:HK97 family phage portal protein
MSIFDWLGPLNAGRTQRSADVTPLPASLPAAQKSVPPGFVPADASGTVVILNRLVQMPAPYDGRRGGDANSAVFACLQVIASSVGEPALRVYRQTPAGQVVVPTSPLGDLLAQPNPHFALDTLLGYVSTCLHVTGNAYWRKLRAGDPETGNVVELWPISPARVEPVTNPGSDDFISFYRYTTGQGRPEEISPTNMVHFRYGIDDADHRLGCAPLQRLLREISSDEQATRYADRLLANLAINGLTLSFDKDSPSISQETADELKARVWAAYGGDNVGGVSVLSPGATLTALGFSPEQMDLKVLHRVPEERISAVLGVPAIVAGLGAGLDRSTFANFGEAREMFTETKLLPLWKSLAADLSLQLVPDFTTDRGTLLAFDTSEVRALADDQNELASRLKTLVEAGIISDNEARAEIGLAPRVTAAAPPPTPEARRRPHIVTLARPPERKAIEDLPRAYEQVRADDLPAWVDDLVAFFAAQQRRVLRRLRAGADTASDLLPDAIEVGLLTETLEPLQLDALEQITRLVSAELGISFQLDDPQTRAYLRSAGINIGGITDHTRAQVQDALIAGQQEGEGIAQLARRLRDLPGFGASRATVVARTELALSSIEASYASYKASGVVSAVTILDGDYDDACAARNGRVIPIDAAGSEPRLLHPNCTAAWAPVVAEASQASA